MTVVALGQERWYVIEFPEVLARRWRRAMRRGEFFPIHYCGALRLVNPRQINYMGGPTL